MSDIPVQILTQVSDNIQKLSELSTRIDERVKSIQSKQDDFDIRMAEVIKTNTELMHRLIVLEQTNGQSLRVTVDDTAKQVVDIDKRLIQLELSSNKQESRWNGIIQFGIQLAWICLASWVLFKMGLNSPAVP